MPRYTKEELLDQLRECKEIYGNCSPRVFRKHRKEHGWAAPSTIMERFDDSWITAKGEAGLEEDISDEAGKSRKYRNEEVLSKMRQLYDEHGKCTIDLMNETPGPSAHVAIERYGKWSEAKKEAEIVEDGPVTGRSRQYSDEDYLELMREFQEEYGELTQRLWDDVASERDDMPTSGAVIKRFRNRDDEMGGWRKAKQLAGITEESRPGGNREQTDEELFEMLRTCQERYQGCSSNDFTSDNQFCSSEVIQRRFGSWNAGKYLAGVFPEEDLEHSHIIHILQYCEEKHGKVTKDIFENDDQFPSVKTVEDRFDTWTTAKKAAGVMGNTKQPA